MTSDSKQVGVAVIKNSDEKYLLLQASKYKEFGKFQDAWYPPSGHVKVNESLEDCLIRELKEELNLDIKPIKQITAFEGDIKGETTYWWECKLISGEIKKAKTVPIFGWFSAEEIKSLKLWPATEKFFKSFI